MKRARLTTVLIALPTLASVMLAACGTGEETAPSSSSAMPSASVGTADPARPLFVYSRSIERPDQTGHGSYVFQVVTYDLGRRRQIGAFQLEESMGPPVLAVAGDNIVAKVASGIVRYDLAGLNPVILRRASSDRGIIEMSVSPDGQRIAITEVRLLGAAHMPLGTAARPNTFVVVLDVATGREVATIPQSASGFDGFVGQAGLLTWRDDQQAVVVQGYLYSEAPGGTAIVMLDGSVRTHDLHDYVKAAPNGRHAEHGSLTSIPIGDMTALQDGIELYDLTAETVVASIGSDGLLYMPWEWSPDGTAFLYSTYSPRPISNWPGFMEQDPASERWYLLVVDGSTPEPVEGRDAVHERWYGERNVQFRCLGKVTLFSYCVDKRGRDQPVEIYVGHTFVGSGFRVEPIGFIDR